MIFSFPHTTEIKDLAIQRIQTKHLYYSVLNIILAEVIPVKQGFKAMFRFVELLNLKVFRAYEKLFRMEAFSTLDVYKNIEFG